MGFDIARGLAVIGMVAAHVAEPALDFDWGDAATWPDIVNGRSAILFALLAGVSIALMTGRTQRPTEEQMPAVRLRLLGRGITIFIIGLLLEQLGTSVLIILTLYGILYVVALPFVRARRRTLVFWSVGLALLGPTLLALVQVLTLEPYASGLALVLQGSYSLPVWVSLMLAGLAIGRSDLKRSITAATVLGVGLVLAAVGYGAGAAYDAREATPPWEQSTPQYPDLTDNTWEHYTEAIVASGVQERVLDALLSSNPHSGGTAELVGSGGFAMVLVALLLLTGRWLRWPLLPVTAVGAMPLTAYSAQIVAIFVLGGPGGYVEDNAVFWWLTGALLASCTLWIACFGRGPLERLAKWVGDRMAG